MSRFHEVDEGSAWPCAKSCWKLSEKIGVVPNSELIGGGVVGAGGGVVVVVVGVGVVVVELVLPGAVEAPVVGTAAGAGLALRSESVARTATAGGALTVRTASLVGERLSV